MRFPPRRPSCTNWQGSPKPYTLPDNLVSAYNHQKLCLGGTFNPIHHGHLLCARAAAEAIGAASVVLIPTGVAPHKSQDFHIAPAQHRLKMCQLAVDQIPGFEVDDREIRRPGASYTIDTVRQLKKEGWSQVCWAIGADMLPTLPTWHEAQALLDEIHWVIMARPGSVLNWSNLPPSLQNLQANIVQVPQIDVSATEIRRRTRSRLPINYLTPPGVCRYIQEQGLYL